ncbi:hypothetical protein ASPFODRAFT_671761 [Aspergillus luchuensis CBS 106.47]|uniref:Uncharacterized protein n=1 Tax=Aspergillus luchuensis (strain CBS 106.47) TaxID=1137211 RepID=A0A1M3TBR1_ASPLC|nr:hypothetical protein ASPFODRAFT_671761 [Aspergillus luchuensis CBS 106.47]
MEENPTHTNHYDDESNTFVRHGRHNSRPHQCNTKAFHVNVDITIVLPERPKSMP